MQTPFTHFDPKIAVQVVRSLINFCERKGLQRDALLQVVSLTEAQLNDARMLIDIQRYENLYAYCSKQLSDSCLGFHFGQKFEADRWGVLGYIALTSQNLIAAMDAQYRFQSLSGNMGGPIQSVDEKYAVLQWVPAYNCSHHMCEQIITGLVSLARTVVNRDDFSPSSVDFTHPPMADKSLYEDYFQCEVTFNSSFNGIHVESHMLQVPLRRSDPETHKMLVAHAESLLTQQSFSSPLEVIKDYVIKTLPNHVPEIDEVAQHLGLSVRSTQRKLQEYGTSFSQVLDAIRKELAITYLQQTQNSVLYISERLGFSEQSAFQRAFKRWTGSTPRQYRLKDLE
jgi:AraC-like DNA-binding protein